MLSWTKTLAKRPLKSVLGNCAIVVVVTPIVVLPTPTFDPTKSTWPTACVPIPDKSELKSILRILISWSFVNFSVGVNVRFFVPSVRT